MLYFLNLLFGGLWAPAQLDREPMPHERAIQERRYRGYFPELDGVRAFGVVLVVLAHTWPHYESWLEIAWILMDLFFVLSGFLVGGILLDSRHRLSYYRTFYMRRALRILPLYYVVLVGVTALAIFVSDPAFHRMLERWGSPGWFFIYLGNIPMALTDRFPRGAHDSFTPLWSLQIEEQFYLLFPLLIHRLPYEKLARALTGLVVLSLTLRLGIYVLLPESVLAQYVLLPCHMEGLALGGLIALRYRMGPWRIPRMRLTVLMLAWVAFACALATFGGFEHDTEINRTIGYFVSSVACAFLVLWMVEQRGAPSTTFFRLAPVLHVGRMSYGIYILHQPVAFVLAVVSGALGMTFLDGGYGHTAAVVLLTYVCSLVSWRYFETPLLRFRDTLERRAEKRAAYSRATA